MERTKWYDASASEKFVKSQKFVKRLGHYPIYKGPLYFSSFINPERLAERIAFSVRALRGYKFDALAFMGISGAIIGPPVAMKLGKTFLMVRKPGNDTHSSWEVEGDYAAKSYIIIDDFQETGYTKNIIKDKIRQFLPKDVEYKGFLAAKHITERRLKQYKEAKKLYPLET